MKTLKEHKFITGCIILAIVVIAAVFAVTMRSSDEEMRAQTKAIEETVSERALQCYVIEDAYPESLEYLQEHYGLAVNTEDYQIVYTPYADNLPPDVKVIYKGGNGHE